MENVIPPPLPLASEDSSASLSERVVFQATVASLFARLPAGALTSALRAEVARLGVDLDRPLYAAYPMSTWIPVVRATARSVFPTDDPDAAHRKLGQRLIEGYVETAIGRAVFAFLKLIGTRRTLERTAKAFRNGNNYCEARVHERGPGDVEVWMNEVGTHPTFIAGVLESGLAHAGAQGVSVTVLSADSEGMTYRVLWR